MCTCIHICTCMHTQIRFSKGEIQVGKSKAKVGFWNNIIQNKKLQNVKTFRHSCWSQVSRDMGAVWEKTHEAWVGSRKATRRVTTERPSPTLTATIGPFCLLMATKIVLRAEGCKCHCSESPRPLGRAISPEVRAQM